MEYREVLPCGKLYTATGQEYFLLHPEPVSKDSWQRDEQQRWVVVPKEPIDVLGNVDAGDAEVVFGYSRHIICSNPTIEYQSWSNPILIQKAKADDIVSDVFTVSGKVAPKHDAGWFVHELERFKKEQVNG